MSTDEKLRLSKLMTERGICSRREADELISKGWVKVNGEVAQIGQKVSSDVDIELAPQARRSLKDQVTILLNKPVGFVSSQPEEGYEPAIVLITPENQFASEDDPPLKREHLINLAPAGRLDIDSQGLLVFTQNGVIARKLIGEDSIVEKEYLVRVEGRLSDEGLQKLRHGLSLDGKELRPARVEWINNDQLKFILKEGRKRQIRRMCELVGLRVRGLKRVRTGRITLSNLPEGMWRFLKPGENF